MYEYVSRHYIELLQDLLTMVKQSQDDYPHRSESNDHLAPGRFSVIWAAAVGHGFSVWPKAWPLSRGQDVFIEDITSFCHAADRTTWDDVGQCLSDLVAQGLIFENCFVDLLGC